jgi:uncharacterized protein YndB with AHSA1/START domain
MIWINENFILYCGPRASPQNNENMDRTKIVLEFIFRASPTIVYNFLTTPACLVRWFCDTVDINGHTYAFAWNDSVESAVLVEDIEDEKIRFEWLDKEPDEFLEFNLSTSPITGETILEIIDFCDEDEVSDYRTLWESQVRTLRKEMGDA